MNEMEVIVDKAELLGVLRTNRSSHRATFEKAVEVYTKTMIKWHRQRARDLLRGTGPLVAHAGFPVPEEHTDDYDTIITMLEMHTEDKFTLGFMEFQNFVMDQWGWSRAFAANTSSYLAK